MGQILRQQGERRKIHSMPWFAAACAGMWMIATSIANGESVAARFPLTPSQVISAMEIRQLPISGVQVRLAAPVTAATTDPKLEIQTVSLLNPHEMRLRMGCSDRSECVAFFAIATYTEEVDPSALKLTTNTAVPKASQATPSAKLLSGSQKDAAALKAAGPIEKPLLRSGSPATLNIDEERVHIRVQVICLEGGVAGDNIHVTSRDRRQTYVAKIITPTLLKGIF